MKELGKAIDMRNVAIENMAERLIELGHSYYDFKRMGVPDACLKRIFMPYKVLKKK
jgi:hypothetical protein